MTTWTKITRTTYESDFRSDKFEVIDETEKKIIALAEAGKTIFEMPTMTFGSTMIVERKWLDQSSAEEWKTYLEQVHQTHSIGLISTEILDASITI